VEITDTYHWKPQDEVKRWEWEAGDVIYIPPNTIHQHFNAASDKPVALDLGDTRIKVLRAERSGAASRTLRSTTPKIVLTPGSSRSSAPACPMPR